MKDYIEASIETKRKILSNEIILNNLDAVINVVYSALSSDKKVLFMGNGGSASDCNHLSTELVSRFYKERKALGAISLTSNNSTLTAIANDYGFENIFSRQIEALGKKGDVIFALSTSGTSKNILKGLKKAKELGLFTIGFTGEMADFEGLCDITINVPSNDTPIIQESHIMLGHLICKMVEERF